MEPRGGEHEPARPVWCVLAWDGRGNPSPSGPPSNNCDSLSVAAVVVGQPRRDIGLGQRLVLPGGPRTFLGSGNGIVIGSEKRALTAQAPRSAVGDFFNFILSHPKKEKEATDRPTVTVCRPAFGFPFRGLDLSAHCSLRFRAFSFPN